MRSPCWLAARFGLLPCLATAIHVGRIQPESSRLFTPGPTQAGAAGRELQLVRRWGAQLHPVHLLIAQRHPIRGHQPSG